MRDIIGTLFRITSRTHVTFFYVAKYFSSLWQHFSENAMCLNKTGRTCSGLVQQKGAAVPSLIQVSHVVQNNSNGPFQLRAGRAGQSRFSLRTTQQQPTVVCVWGGGECCGEECFSSVRERIWHELPELPLTWVWEVILPPILLSIFFTFHPFMCAWIITLIIV